MNRRGRQLKDHAAEAALFRRRALVGFLGALLGLGALAGWYFSLQVLRHDEFATQSEANRVRLVPVVPARGLIYDRKGRILADNVSAWRLDAVPERAGDGVALLRATLLRLAGFQPGAEGVFAARERHLQALRETLAHLAEARAHGAAGNATLELFAEELRLAHRALGRITGEVSADELLGAIFSRFCIGK